MFARNNNRNLAKNKNQLAHRTFRANLAYFERFIQLNSGANTADEYVFRANGIFDPNVTGVGHQALGFDQLMLMYTYFRVLKAHIEVKFISSDATYDHIVGVRVSTLPTIDTNVGNMIENGYSEYQILTKAGGSSPIRTVTYDLDVQKWFGASASDEDKLGTVAADPTELVYFHIFDAAVNTASDAGTVDVLLKITYFTEFTVPKYMVPS